MTGQPTESSIFENRLRKNARHLRKWARRTGLTAYRIYDRDAPEYPVAVDWYDGRVHVVEYPRRRALRDGSAAELREEVVAAIERTLGVPRRQVFVKTHVPMAWGREQHERKGEGNETFLVEEEGLKLWVNLGDYLDTGLFLDHRLTRARVREEAKGKRFLNLFAYTGSFSVYAAAGGAASTTSVDLSNTYCDWAARNLEANGFTGPRHRVVRADALRWLDAERSRYDLIVLDPPSFSTSSTMQRSFEVQRDHPRLIASAMGLLSRGGALYFSTHFQGFRLEICDWAADELTPRSIPEDFRQKDVHRCWRVTA